MKREMSNFCITSCSFFLCNSACSSQSLNHVGLKKWGLRILGTGIYLTHAPQIPATLWPLPSAWRVCQLPASSRRVLQTPWPADKASDFSCLARSLLGCLPGVCILHPPPWRRAVPAAQRGGGWQGQRASPCRNWHCPPFPTRSQNRRAMLG